MKHLTDDEIQSYLHRLQPDERVRLKDHLNGCSDCRKQLLLYKKLGDVVVSASLKPIPEGFETAVMGKLRSVQRITRITDIFVFAIAFLGFILMGLIVFLTPQLKHIVTVCLMDAWYFGSEIATDVAESSDVIGVPLFGIILFMLFAAVDRLTVTKLGLNSEIQS